MIPRDAFRVALSRESRGATATLCGSLETSQAKQRWWRTEFETRPKGLTRLKLAVELVSAVTTLLLGTDCYAAASASAPVHLVWSAPRQCPQHGEVMSRIQKLLGASSPLREELDPLDTRAGIEPFKGQFRLTLWIQDGATTGTRSITSTSCQSLGDAAAVVLSLLIRQRRELGRALSNEELSGRGELDAGGGNPPENPAADAPGSTQPGANAAAPEDETTLASRDGAAATRATDPNANANRARTRDEQTKSRLSTAASDQAESGRRWKIFLAAPVAHLEFWTLPQANRGAGLALGLTYDDWYFFTSVGLFAAQRVHFGGARAFDAEFRSRSISGWVCRAWEKKPFRFAPCAVVAANSIEASASSERLASKSRTGTWLSAGGGALSSIHLGQLVAIAARAAGRLTLNRPEFVLDGMWGEQQIHRAPAGSVEVTLGCDWFF